MKLNAAAAAIAALMTLGLSAQENLIQGGSFETAEDLKSWPSGHWVHIGPSNGDYRKLLKEIAPFCKRQLEQDAKSGTSSAKILTDKAFHSIKDNKGGILTVSNSINQIIAVAPGQYKLTAWVKGKNESVPGYNALRLFVNCTKQDKKVSSLLDYQFKLSNEWTRYEKIITVPADGVSVQLRFALYGAGEVQIDDVVFEKVK